MNSDRIDFFQTTHARHETTHKGFEQRRFYIPKKTGSHRHYVHADGRLVVVPHGRSGGTHPIKTLRSMLQDQARWTMDNLRRLGLL